MTDHSQRGSHEHWSAYDRRRVQRKDIIVRLVAAMRERGGTITCKEAAEVVGAPRNTVARILASPAYFRPRYRLKNDHLPSHYELVQDLMVPA